MLNVRIDIYVYNKIYNVIYFSIFHIDRPYVEIRTEPMLHITKEKIIGIESHEQELTCEIDANPAATSIYWTINSTNIISRKEIEQEKKYFKSTFEFFRRNQRLFITSNI